MPSASLSGFFRDEAGLLHRVWIAEPDEVIHEREEPMLSWSLREIVAARSTITFRYDHDRPHLMVVEQLPDEPNPIYDALRAREDMT
ncbi:hypothetical protein [Microbacterium sp. BG28]|uniref:hypothetical protein n=1 Tax=Microbacterium sp. BG28 TaxID=3097356 RepID=UPI002A5A4721|nr:hypothetical protein [Microbacterium sp. BG28]